MQNLRLGASVAVALWLGAAAPVSAQTRTWVSGVGDDVNPCSRTAPCKTFAGAISKTAAGGEIDALDPGGFGAVTITKSITLDGNSWGSILASATTGIIIAAGAGDVVTIRNLSISGGGNGLRGIRIVTAGAVHIEGCTIFGFGGSPGRGISDERPSGRLFVMNTTVRNNASTGIVVVPASQPGSVAATIDRVHSDGNGNAGIALSGGGKMMVSFSVASGNTSAGFYVDTSGSEFTVSHSVSAKNGTGLFASLNAVLRLDDSDVTGNNVGLSQTTGGTIFSYGGNRIDGNVSGNTGASPISHQ